MIAVADFETDPFMAERVPEVFAAGLYDGESFFYWWGNDAVDDFLEYVDESDIKTIFMHNGGNFDFHFFVERASYLFMLKNRIAKMRVAGTMFIDSYPFLPVALKITGDKLDIDYNKMESDVRDEHHDEIVEYLKADCIALYRMVSSFREQFDKRSFTVAGAGLKQLKDTGYTVPNLSKHSDSLVRPYYFGGRVEAKNGVYEDMTYIDINSSYPRAMLEEHPSGNDFEVDRQIHTDCYFATIRAESKGYFAFRNEDFSMSFPADGHTRQFKATSWEIQHFLDNGGDIDVLEVLNFYETANMQAFVEKFYAMKLKAELDGDSQTRLFAKLLLNSVYGKFGINPEKFMDYSITPLGECPPEDEWSLVCDTELDTSIWERPQEGRLDKYLHVGISASITGYARMALHAAMLRVDRPVYCDTDSIICADTANLTLGTGIGEWSVEANFETLYVAGKKLYAGRTTDGTEKIASKGALLTFDDIRRLTDGEIVEWTNEAPSFSLRTRPRFTKRRLKATD